MAEPKWRSVGDTERSWCRAACGGTGTAVLALQTSKSPDLSRLQATLHALQTSHPILRSRLLINSLSFLTSPSPSLKLTSHTLPANLTDPLTHVLQLELNLNTWHHELFFATLYTLPDKPTSVVALRLHVSACDRTTALLLLRVFLNLMEGDTAAENNNINNNKRDQPSLPLERLLPRAMAKKPLWTRGLDMLAYSLNSFTLTNLDFVDTRTPRFSQLLRFQLNQNHTKQLLAVTS